MKNQLNCLHPKVIFNPLVKELLVEHCNYTLFGKYHSVSSLIARKSYFNDKVLIQSSLNSVRNMIEDTPGIKSEILDSCFIMNTDNGQCFPIFMEVPCGHCDCCKSAKVNAFVHRCKLETMFYDSLPIFLTLTYNDENKPKEGVLLRDVQLFFKRLRVNLWRQGYREKFRYVLVSEYGRKGRPHYHAILWNLHQTSFFSYGQILRTIEKSWNKGFITSRFVDTSDDKCFAYTAKYLAKGGNVPVGQNETFVCSSNRGGGIGRPFVEFLKSEIRRDLNRDIKFCNRFVGRAENLYLNRYVLDVLFPSFSKSVFPSLRTRVVEYCKSLFILKCYFNDESVNLFDYDFNFVYDFFSHYFYIPSFDIHLLETQYLQTREYYLRNVLKLENFIGKAVAKGHCFYEECEENQRLRDIFLGKLFMFEQPIKSLDNRAYRFRRSLSLSKQREVL